MVDAIARRRYAAILRYFAAGLLTNDEYESWTHEIIGESRDDGVWSIYQTVWGLYSDIHEHRLRGDHELLPETRRVLARCVLFLRSGQTYDWPSSSPGSCILNLATFGIYSARRARNGVAQELALDDQAWPFRDRQSLQLVSTDPRNRFIARRFAS